MKCTAQVTMNIVMQLTQPWDTSKANLNEVFDQAKREAQRKVSQLLTAAGDEIKMRGDAIVTAVFILNWKQIEQALALKRTAETEGGK